MGGIKMEVNKSRRRWVTGRAVEPSTSRIPTSTGRRVGWPQDGVKGGVGVKNDSRGDQCWVSEVKEAREKCGETPEPGEGGGYPLGEITSEVGWQGNEEGGWEGRSLGGWGIRGGWGYEESNGNTQG
jgi:hypothetical protein